MTDYKPDAAWGALMDELDAWSAAGRVATFWWRDAVSRHTSSFERLLSLRDQLDVPLALAVIPTVAGTRLQLRLSDEDQVSVLQHGYSHKDFSDSNGPKIELDDSRPSEYVVAELAMGVQAIKKFTNSLPILVPPWNRISPHLIPFLPEVGISGLSTIGARIRETPIRGLRQNNIHLDLSKHQGSQGGAADDFLGAEVILADAVMHLSARRRGTADPGEATGLMTHHADMDGGMFRFVVDFVSRTRSHPAAVWRPATEVFLIS
ncbi:MAG: hypothetical protein CL573_01540 [Alphaproteobacteria bacterium]|nr:hypothetical protein [Alphaproteobacteria bacterium]